MKIPLEKMPAAIALQNAFVDAISQMPVEEVVQLVMTIGGNDVGEPEIEKLFEDLGKRLEAKGIKL